jgi:hypothetical protein
MAALLAVAAALVLALSLGAERAGAAIVLGSDDPSGPPDRFACAACAGGTSIGLRQFALQGATLEAPEPGVLVSARVFAKRAGGAEQPRIAVLRPSSGIGAEVVASAPLPVSSAQGVLEEAVDLHLPVEPGDSLGFLFRTGEVDVGARTRPHPDGAVVSFELPCTPCGTTGVTGLELLLQGVVEPDEDGDLLGDESQDPDGGGAVDDAELPPEDFDEELFEDPEFGTDGTRGRRRGRLRLLRTLDERDGGVTLVLSAPAPGRLEAKARALAGRHRTLAAGRTRATRAGRVRLRLKPRPGARKLLAGDGRVQARLTVSFSPRRGRRQGLTRTLTLGRSGRPAT